MGEAASSLRPTTPIHHYDPGQLLFQIHEIYERLTYLSHGVVIQPGATVLDVGANVGVASVFFAERGAGSVHAFEAIPALQELLEENLRPHPACVAHPYGIGAESGRVQFSFYPRAAAMSSRYADPKCDAEAVRGFLESPGGDQAGEADDLASMFAREQVSCELRPLSRVIAEEGIETIDLLKVDVERAEHEVLAGLGAEDWRRVRQVAIEVHDEEGRAAALAGLLRGHGLEVTEVQDPEWRGTDLKMLYGMRT